MWFPGIHLVSVINCWGGFRQASPCQQDCFFPHICPSQSGNTTWPPLCGFSHFPRSLAFLGFTEACKENSKDCMRVGLEQGHLTQTFLRWVMDVRIHWSGCPANRISFYPPFLAFLRIVSQDVAKGRWNSHKGECFCGCACDNIHRTLLLKILI